MEGWHRQGGLNLKDEVFLIPSLTRACLNLHPVLWPGIKGQLSLLFPHMGVLHGIDLELSNEQLCFVSFAPH